MTGVLRSLAESGLDLAVPFDVADYQREVGQAYRLPDFGRARALALMIGNTRALWPPFIEALVAAPERLEDSHPLDRYVEDAVHAALFGAPVAFEVRFAHEPPPRRFAAQRAAKVAGLAHLSDSHMSVHPVFGPWIALRAAVVFDADPPLRAAPTPPPCRCEEGCGGAFGRALERERGRAADWRTWLAVRDACPVGREHRYGDEQIRYHYTKDRGALREAMARARETGVDDA